MAGDMISLCARRATVLPLAGETEVVGTLATNMVVTEMVVKSLWVDKGFVAINPLTEGRRR